MKILPFSRRFYDLCGVCAPPEGSDFVANSRQMITVVYIFVSTQVMELGFIMYALYQLEMGNIFNLLFAVLHVAASNAARLSYITVIPQSKNLRDLFSGMQTILNQCKFRKTSKFLRSCHLFGWNFSNFSTAEHSPLAKQYYSKTNELCDKILKWSLIIQASCYVIPALSILVCGAIFYYIHDGHVEPQNLYMPLKTR